MDVLKHANAFGTSRYGGVLAVVGDDHACKSSTLPHQSDHMFIGATSPVLNPAGVQEVLDLGIFGWELSRYSGCWVGLKAITENMDAAISADIDSGRVEVVIPEDYELPEDGVHIRWPDSPMAQEERLQRHKIYAARAFARANNLNRIELDSDNARLGIVTTGKGVTIHTIDCETLTSFADTPERWLDVAWEANADDDGHIGRISVIIANEPGSLGSLSTIIGKNEGNIANLKITNRSQDFFEILVDIQVRDVRHLTNIIAALRATPVINSVERARG
jgi:hypothetical protein